MLSIRKLRGEESKYEMLDFEDHNRARIAVIDGLKPAACIMRFIKGAHLQPDDYQLAVNTMAEIDARKGENGNAGWKRPIHEGEYPARETIPNDG